jgi:hypothetical protein
MIYTNTIPNNEIIPNNKIILNKINQKYLRQIKYWRILNKNASKTYKNITPKNIHKKHWCLKSLADLEKLGSRQCWRIWKS